MAKNTRLVYSTEPDWERKYCRECGRLLTECECNHAKPSGSAQTIYVERNTKGRGGKTVTLIDGIGTDAEKWKKELQKLCASGGTLKKGIIEIQGDHRDKIREFLEKAGFRVKFRGG